MGVVETVSVFPSYAFCLRLQRRRQKGEAGWVEENAEFLFVLGSLLPYVSWTAVDTQAD